MKRIKELMEEFLSEDANDNLVKYIKNDKKFKAECDKFVSFYNTHKTLPNDKLSKKIYSIVSNKNNAEFLSKNYERVVNLYLSKKIIPDERKRSLFTIGEVLNYKGLK